MPANSAPATSSSTATGSATAPARQCPPLQAVLWDFDGTMVDSERVWMAQESALAARFGGVWTPEQARGQVGRSVLSTAAKLIEQVPPGDHDPVQWKAWLEESVERELRTGPIPWLPGVLELVAEIRDAGLRSAIVTSSPRPVVESILQRLAEPVAEFAVTSDEVTRPKPDPQPYLMAAERLGVPITACVALEDSAPGATAARDAGAFVVMVPHGEPIDLAADGLVVDSLDGLTLAAIEQTRRAKLGAMKEKP